MVSGDATKSALWVTGSPAIWCDRTTPTPGAMWVEGRSDRLRVPRPKIRQ